MLTIEKSPVARIHRARIERLGQLRRRHRLAFRTSLSILLYRVEKALAPYRVEGNLPQVGSFQRERCRETAHLRQIAQKRNSKWMQGLGKLLHNILHRDRGLKK